MNDARREDPEGLDGSRDQEQRLRLVEARLHAQERALRDQRFWTIAAVLLPVVYLLLRILIW